MIKEEVKTMSNTTLTNRHGTLFLWEVRKSNPNGDPSGNEPRIDRYTKKCDVTDVCIKRSVRGYIAVKEGIDSLLVTKLGKDASETVTLNERLGNYLFGNNNLAGTVAYIKNAVKGRLNEKTDAYKQFLEKPSPDGLKKLLDKLGKSKDKEEEKAASASKKEDEKEKIVVGNVSADEVQKDIINSLRAYLCGTFKDLRMFGSVLALKGNLKILGGPLTGPIQIEVATSLHRVVQSNKQITSVMGSKEEKEAGIIGDTHCIEYGLFATSSVANENVAKFTGLSNEDHDLFLKALWRGTRDRHTRSKNQVPRLLIDIEYNKPFHFGDLVNSIKLNPIEKNGKPVDEEAYRSIEDFTIDLSKFYQKIESKKGAKGAVQSIKFASNELMTFKQFKECLHDDLKGIVTEIPNIDFE